MEIAQAALEWIRTGRGLGPQDLPGTRNALAEALVKAAALAMIREDMSSLGFPQPWTPPPPPLECGSWIDRGSILGDAAVQHARKLGFEPTNLNLPEVIEGAFGVDVVVTSVGPGLDGLVVGSPHTKLIVAATTLRVARQRIMMAHQLGHLIAGDVVTLHVDEDISGGLSRNGGAEIRANAFAEAFLLPRDRLVDACPGHEITMADFCNLAVDLVVTPRQLAYRLLNLGLIDGMSAEWFRNISVHDAVREVGRTADYGAARLFANTPRSPMLLVRDAETAYADQARPLQSYAKLIGSDEMKAVRAALGLPDETSESQSAAS